MKIIGITAIFTLFTVTSKAHEKEKMNDMSLPHQTSQFSQNAPLDSQLSKQATPTTPVKKEEKVHYLEDIVSTIDPGKIISKFIIFYSRL